MGTRSTRSAMARTARRTTPTPHTTVAPPPALAGPGWATATASRPTAARPTSPPPTLTAEPARPRALDSCAAPRVCAGARAVEPRRLSAACSASTCEATCATAAPAARAAVPARPAAATACAPCGASESSGPPRCAVAAHGLCRASHIPSNTTAVDPMAADGTRRAKRGRRATCVCRDGDARPRCPNDNSISAHRWPPSRPHPARKTPRNSHTRSDGHSSPCWSCLRSSGSSTTCDDRPALRWPRTTRVKSTTPFDPTSSWWRCTGCLSPTRSSRCRIERSAPDDERRCAISWRRRASPV